MDLALTGNGDNDTVLSLLGSDGGRSGGLGLGNVLGQAVNGEVATRIVLVDDDNLVIHLSIQPVGLIIVHVASDGRGNGHDGLLGTSLGDSKAILVVRLLGIDVELLAVPNKREHTIASALARQCDTAGNKVLTIGDQLLGSSVAGNIQQSVFTSEILEVVDNGRAGGSQTVAGSGIALVDVHLTTSDGHNRNTKGGSTGQVDNAVFHQVALGKAHEVAATLNTALGGNNVFLHLVGLGVDHLDGSLGPRIGELGVADDQVASLVTGQTAVGTARIGGGGQTVLANHIDGLVGLVVDIELSVHTEALTGVGGVQERYIRYFPNLLKLVSLFLGSSSGLDVHGHGRGINDDLIGAGSNLEAVGLSKAAQLNVDAHHVLAQQVAILDSTQAITGDTVPVVAVLTQLRGE